MTPLQQIINLVRSSKNILILGHQNPDGDAIGSAVGLLLVLRKLEKRVSSAASDPVPPPLAFLPALENFETSIAGANDLVLNFPLGDRKDAEVFSKTEDGFLKVSVRPIGGSPFKKEEIDFAAGEADFDLIICVDVPDLPQLGGLFEANPNIFYEIPVINIDHHASNTGFGKINFVDATAASSSELILRLIRSLESEFNKKLLDEDIATLILTGIITDTGSFQNSNTTPRSLELAADLVEAGARQQEIIHHVYKTKELSTLKLWGRVLAKIEFDAEHRIVWSTVTTEDFATAGAVDSATDGLIDELLSNAPGAEIILLLKQKGEVISGSVRTTTPAVSSTDVAGLFGGGGHHAAAGFKIPDKKVENITGDVLEKIRQFQSERLNLISENLVEKIEIGKTKKKPKK